MPVPPTATSRHHFLPVVQAISAAAMPARVRRRSIWRVALLLSASFADSADAAEATPLDRADTVIRAVMRAERIPGLGVAVVDRGRVVLARGYGYANVEHHVPVTIDTVFQSGSLGKQFTAAAVMLGVEDGLLSLDDPVGRFLPEAPPEWAAVRIRHLLTHTAGIPDYTGEALPEDVRRSYTLDELVQLACSLRLEFEPGERFSYSNPGYLLLGAILDRVGGRHYSDLLRERIFQPLGMKSARLIDEADIVMHRAAGYRLLNGQLANQEWLAPELNTTGEGSLYLSIRDMIAWDRGLRDGKVLSASSWHTVFTPVRLNSGVTCPYGFGWAIDSVDGHTVVSHSGGTQGFETYIARYLGDDLTVIVLTNLAEADPERIGLRLAAVFREHLAKPDAAIADVELRPDAQESCAL